jgi:hypothetical protein
VDVPDTAQEQERALLLELDFIFLQHNIILHPIIVLSIVFFFLTEQHDRSFGDGI